VQAARRRTFATIDPAAVPPADRALARDASQSASREAFHVAVGIGAGLLLIAGGGGLALRPGARRESPAEGDPATATQDL
jgi:hypothetical protein